MSFSWTPEGQRHCSGHKCIPDFQDPQLDQACQSQVPCEGKWWDWGQKRWAEQTLILPWFTHKTTYKPSIVPWPSASLTLDPGGQIMELLELHTKKEPEPESPLAGTHLQSAVHILDFRWPLYNWFPVDHHIDRCLFQQLTLLTHSIPYGPQSKMAFSGSSSRTLTTLLSLGRPESRDLTKVTSCKGGDVQHQHSRASQAGLSRRFHKAYVF